MQTRTTVLDSPFVLVLPHFCNYGNRYIQPGESSVLNDSWG